LGVRESERQILPVAILDKVQAGQRGGAGRLRDSVNAGDLLDLGSLTSRWVRSRLWERIQED